MSTELKYEEFDKERSVSSDWKLIWHDRTTDLVDLQICHKLVGFPFSFRLFSRLYRELPRHMVINHLRRLTREEWEILHITDLLENPKLSRCIPIPIDNQGFAGITGVTGVSGTK